MPKGNTVSTEANDPIIIPAAQVHEVEGKIKKAKTKAANEVVAVKKITDKKDLIYNYPEDMDNLSKRKKFRTQARAALKQLNKKILAIKSAGKKANPDEKAVVIKEVHDFACQRFQPESIQYKTLLKFA